MDGSFRTLDSFLSPEVRGLLGRAVDQQQVDRSQVPPAAWLSHYLHLNWDIIEQVFRGISEEAESRGWYRAVVEGLRPLLLACLTSLTSPHHKHLLHTWLQWTNQWEELWWSVGCVSPDHCPSDHLLALLVTTAATERALADLVLMRQEQVPFLLRDLLTTPALEHLFGHTRVQVLRVLLGSVLGLNLRNVAWHGFLSPKEAHPAFVATLLVVLADCGRHLSLSHNITTVTSKQRPSFTRASYVWEVFEGAAARGVVEEVVAASPLVPAVLAPAWHRVLHWWQCHSWGLCLSLLLPLLECSLRCLFACTNAASHRLLTAQDSAFYTTLDEILAPSVIRKNAEIETFQMVPSPDHTQHQQSEDRNQRTQSTTAGEDKPDHGMHKQEPQPPTEPAQQHCPNAVLSVIGERLNVALHDLLSFMQGPRVRDRLSHGEVRLGEVPGELVNHVMHLTVLILCLGNWRCRTDAEAVDGHTEDGKQLIRTEAMNSNTKQKKNKDCSDCEGNCCVDVINECLKLAELDKASDEVGVHENDKMINGGMTEGRNRCENPTHKQSKECSCCINICSACMIVKHSQSREKCHIGKTDPITTEKMAKLSDRTQNIPSVNEILDFLTLRDISNEASDAIKKQSHLLGNYKSRYHPSALLLQRLILCVSDIGLWKTWPRVDQGQMEHKDWQMTVEQFDLPQYIRIPPLDIAHRICNFNKLEPFLRKLESHYCLVLYRPREELELVSLLDRITSSVQLALGNMRENLAVKFQQFTEKKLRSRQRGTYVRQLNVVPTITMNFYLTLQVVYALLAGVNSTSQPKCSLVDFLNVMRTVLKNQENLVTLTSLKSNRWEEALHLALGNISLIRQRFCSS